MARGSKRVAKKSKIEYENIPKVPLTVTLPSELLVHITNFIPRSYLQSVQLACKTFDTVVRNSERNVRPQIVNMLASINKYLKENKFGVEEKEDVLTTLARVIKEEQKKLEAQKCFTKKKQEWSDWLQSTKEPGLSIRPQPKITQEQKRLIKEKLFDKVEFLAANMERMDYRYEYNAKIKIGDIIIGHHAYDEEGCNTSWSMYQEHKIDEDVEHETIAAMSGEDRDESVLAVANEKMAYFKEEFGLKAISDDAMIDVLVLALPWRKDMNAVFHTAVQFMSQDDVRLI